MIEPWTGQLPHEFLSEPIHSRLSADAQLYYECPNCHLHWRLNPTVCFGDPDAATGATCRGCREGKLYPIRILIGIEAACSDCRHLYTAETTGFDPVRCPNCESGAYTPIGFKGPYYRSEFGDIMGGAYVWGIDATEDTQKIVEEVQIASGMPDFVRYMIPAVLFARRLRVWGAHPAESHAEFKLTTLEANLLRDYYRRTNELSAGADSITAFEESVEAASGDLEKAMSEHNVAMAVYSVMARGFAEVASELLERPGLIAEGAAAAERAIEHHRACSPADNPQAAMHIARIEHLLGDYLKVQAETDEERREAIAHFDRALAEPSLPPELKNGVRDSRSAVLASLEHPTPDETQRTASDFEAVLSRDESDRVWSNKLTAWANRAIHADSVGDPDTAWDAILHAAGIAQDELDRAVDQTGMRQAATSYVRVFDQLARIGAKQGRPIDALAAVETVRASSIAYPDDGTGTAPEVSQRNLGWQWRALKGLFTNRGAAASAPEEPRLEDAIERIRRLDARLLPNDGAFLCVSGASRTVTALIVRLDTGNLLVEPHQWVMDSNDLSALALPLESDDELLNNLDEMIDAGYRMLIEPIHERLDDLQLGELAVSFPGVLNRLAVEAMTPEKGGSPIGASVGVYNLPSLSLGVELAGRPGPSEPNLLIVSYLEDDLAGQEAELDALRTAFHGRVMTIGGRAQTKGDVIDAMSSDVSHIHFLCHGTFDAVSPLDSALHLVRNPSSDRYRISARDLSALELRSGPIVTLAACSSGLTSYGPANDLSGLAGGFLRAGARGVVGSRWDVHDDAAASFMTALYGHLADLEVSPVTAVSAAQNQVRAEFDATEDWAAFGYLGAP